MASGKKSRERKRAAAAAAPPVRSKGAPRSRQASPRVLIGAAAAAALIAVAVVLIVVFTGGTSDSSTSGGVPAVGSIATGLPGAPNADLYFEGIPQSGMTLGSPSAPVTLVEYIDLQCPFCRTFDTEVLPNIVEKYVRTGKVKVEARVVAFIGPDSVSGRRAMIAAGKQNRAFNYAEILYFNQGTENTGWLNEDMIASAAASIPGLKVARLLADRSDSAVSATAKGFDEAMKADKVTQTPTILVGRSGSKAKAVAMSSASDEASVSAAIDNALQG